VGLSGLSSRAPTVLGRPRARTHPFRVSLSSPSLPTTFHGTAATLSPIEQVCAACGVGPCDPPHAAGSSREVLKFGFGLVESGRPTGLCASCSRCGTFPSGLLYTRGHSVRDRAVRVGGGGGGGGWGGGAGVGSGVGRCRSLVVLQPQPSNLPTPAFQLPVPPVRAKRAPDRGRLSILEIAGFVARGFQRRTGGTCFDQPRPRA
jgi:hypothetical protein